MTKVSFILALHERLSDLPKADVEERLRFYSEMIEDRMEEGVSEEAAVAAVGTVEQIAEQIRADFIPEEYPISPDKKSTKWWVVLLLILGSPIWVSLLVAVVAVILSLYISLWAVIVSFWAAFGSAFGGAIGAIVTGVGLLFAGHSVPGLAFLAAGLVCAGISIFLFYGCKLATKGTVAMTGKIMKCCGKRREVARCEN